MKNNTILEYIYYYYKMSTKTNETLIETTKTSDIPKIISQVEPDVVILVGLMGSGKSTLCKQGIFPDFKRINQDQLGSRKKCEIVGCNKSLNNKKTRRVPPMQPDEPVLHHKQQKGEPLGIKKLENT